MTSQPVAETRPSALKSIAAFVLFVLVWVVVATLANFLAQTFYGLTGEFGGWALLFVAALVSAIASAHFALEAVDRWMRNIYHRAVVRTFSVLVIVGGLAGLLPVYGNDYSAKVLADVFHLVVVGFCAWTFEKERSWR